MEPRRWDRSDTVWLLVSLVVSAACAYGAVRWAVGR